MNKKLLLLKKGGKGVELRAEDSVNTSVVGCEVQASVLAPDCPHRCSAAVVVAVVVELMLAADLSGCHRACPPLQVPLRGGVGRCPEPPYPVARVLY